MKYFLIVILAGCCNLMSIAQNETSLPPLSLDDYRQAVTAYSNTLKSSSEAAFSAAEKVKLLRTGYLPSLAAGATANYQVNYPMSFIPMKDYNYSANLTISQTVYNGGLVRANTDAARISYNIAKENQQFALLNTIYSADLTYWALAASIEQMDIAETYVQIINDLYSIVKIRFEDGYISRTDLLMVETRLNEAALQLITATRMYQDALISLNILMGNRDSKAFNLTTPISNLAPVSSIVKQSYSLENHPQYRAAVLNVDLSGKSIKIARSGYNPQFNVGFQGVYGTLSPNVSGDAKPYGVAFASLNIPLFMWSARRHNVAIAKASTRISQNSLADTEDKLTSDLSTAVTDMYLIMDQAEVAQKNLNVAKENLDLNTFSYNEGKLPILDVLQSQLSWIQAYTGFVNSTYSYQTSVAKYELSTGAESTGAKPSAGVEK